MIKEQDLHDAIKEYRAVQYNTKRAQYHDGYIFDEEKSVRWNREELERRNKESEAEYKLAIEDRKNKYETLINICSDYVRQELDYSILKSNRLVHYLIDRYNYYELSEELITLVDVLKGL